MQAAGVNFAVLGELESCTGDAARRAGNEYLYQEMASANVETINEVFGERKRRIVVTCPHCLHNLGKEYHQFGGDYEVVHHTELIDELIAAGKLPKSAHPDKQPNVTFHDPCYLGRHNGVIEAPRDVIDSTGVNLVEMPRSGTQFVLLRGGRRAVLEGRRTRRQSRQRRALSGSDSHRRGSGGGRLPVLYADVRDGEIDARRGSRRQGRGRTDRGAAASAK